METVGWILLYTLLGLLGAFLLFVLFIVISSLFIRLNKQYENDSRFYRVIIRIISTLIVRLCRIRVHATGAELLPEEPFLLVCNHRSNFDPILTWWAYSKPRFIFITKEANLRIPIFGRFVHRVRFLAIDREDPRKAMETIRRAAELMQEDRVCVGVYPEGTRSKSGELLPFHAGVCKLAQKANAHVAVGTIRGVENVHKNAPWRATDVYLDVVEVIPADVVKAQRSTVLSDAVRDRIVPLVDKK